MIHILYNSTYSEKKSFVRYIFFKAYDIALNQQASLQFANYQASTALQRTSPSTKKSGGGTQVPWTRHIPPPSLHAGKKRGKNGQKAGGASPGALSARCPSQAHHSPSTNCPNLDALPGNFSKAKTNQKTEDK